MQSNGTVGSVGRRLRWCAVAVTIVGWLSAGAAPAQPGREQSWKRSDSAHFTFFYTGSEKGVQRLSEDLETLRALIGSLAPGGAPASPRPTFVYVFRSEKSYRPYYPLRDGKPWPVASYFSPQREANYVSLDGSGDVRKPAFTAYGFDFVGTHFKNLPYWLHKGLAEYYGTFRASAKKLDVGRPDIDNLRVLGEGGLIPMERLFAATRDSEMMRREAMRRRFSAQAWATVHYLLHSEDRPGQLTHYMQLLDRGAPESEAFQASFGTAPKAMTVDVFGYITQRRFFFGQIDADRIQIDPSFTTRDMAWDETLYRLGDLAAAMDGREGEAVSHYEASLAKNPEQAGGHTGLGILRYREGEHEDALVHFERAVALDSADFRAHLFHSLALTETRKIEDGWWDDLSDESRSALETARRSAERCIEREPEIAECHSQLGYTYFWNQNPRPGIDAYETALRLQPVRDWTALQLIRLHSNAGLPHRAQELLEVYAERFDAGQQEQAARAIRQAHLTASHRAAEADDFQNAVVHLEKAIERTADPGERRSLEQRLGAMKERLEP